jgi:hypothetical protein
MLASQQEAPGLLRRMLDYMGQGYEYMPGP